MLNLFWNPDPVRYPEGIRISGTMLVYGGSSLFVGYVENCFSPALILVSGDTFEDAHENLLLHPIIKQSTVITDPDLADYDPETVQYNADGEPVDTEAVQLVQVTGPPLT